jgi:uncharacterized protein (TIGR03435 family)
MNTPRVPSSLVLLTIVLVAVCSAAVRRVRAEADREPAFDVTSIKANRSGALPVGGPGDRFSHGQLHTTNIPLRLLIREAFQLPQDDELVGGPSWLDTDRWDITARTEAPTAAMLPMVRSLLRDRFKLETHFEKRELPVYALVLARTDGGLGPTIRPTTEPPNFREGIGTLTGRAPINVLVSMLAFAAERHVVDRTGLHGTYEVNLHWLPMNLPASVTPDVPDSPSIFTAVQEQLGLKLESATAPVDVLVIDQVEKPAAD